MGWERMTKVGTGPPCPVGDGDLSAPSGGELTSPTCELTPSPSAGNAPSSLLGITAEDERVLKRVEVVEMLQLQHVNPHPVKPGGEGKALSQEESTRCGGSARSSCGLVPAGGSACWCQPFSWPPGPGMKIFTCFGRGVVMLWFSAFLSLPHLGRVL